MSTIIRKLPSSWGDYQKKLKHKTKSLNLDQLLQHIQIENEARMRDMLVNKDNVHNVESSSSKSFKSKFNKFHNRKKGFLNKKKRFESKEGIKKKKR